MTRKRMMELFRCTILEPTNNAVLSKQRWLNASLTSKFDKGVE